MTPPIPLPGGHGHRASLREFRKTLVVLLHGIGDDDHTIAALLGVCTRTVANLRREEGLPVNRKPRQHQP
ncbi:MULTISPECIES: hypothetical protein [Deinococcus]|uniref:Helix-turn-helix domain-containing protein n=1 Tax=Deinococcus rufus TaxID=2136097 RepID=A0ABV7Z997_9DEIO|nr:hypothetical protein [Deinococcus sp. AB2017081]WQE94981.1 hypothetical protein U2P90_16555 [Deinococcus sp. AB2017081]